MLDIMVTNATRSATVTVMPHVISLLAPVIVLRVSCCQTAIKNVHQEALELTVGRLVNVRMVLHVIQWMVPAAAWLVGRAPFVSKAVLMDGTVQGVTAAVTVYTTRHVIMSMENVPAMQVGRESNVTNHVTVDFMDLAASQCASAMKAILYHVTLSMDVASVSLDGLGKSARYFVLEESLVQIVYKTASA